MRALVATLFSVFLIAPAGAQQMYKWVDDNGTVHFTDSPPPETVEAERRMLSGARTALPEELVDPETSSDEIDALYSPEQRQRACAQARANHTTLTNMPVVVQDLDGDGVPEELTDEQRAAALARADTQIRLLCTD